MTASEWIAVATLFVLSVGAAFTILSSRAKDRRDQLNDAVRRGSASALLEDRVRRLEERVGRMDSRLRRIEGPGDDGHH